MVKVMIAFFLGIGLYGFLSYYQPMAESYYSANAATEQHAMLFASPIPFELILSQTSH